MIDLYLRHLEAAGLSAYTLRNYRSDIAAYLRGKDPLALDRHDLRSYLTSLNGTAQREPACRGPRPRSFAGLVPRL